MLQRVETGTGTGMGQAGQQGLRSALGRFPTGVAVVTMAGSDGQVHCMTVNSFASLSLDPPLVMWALRTSSARHDILTRGERFAINVLSESQIELARRHAVAPPVLSPIGAWPAMLDGCPIMQGASAHFVCRTSGQLPQGDHTLLVGEVQHFAENDHHPLLFMSGGFYSGQGLKPL
jgi:3-hydroxy-9,10-secoandrosta-1,3,5(10)-triene-9,17-dione monooxygenase reductase component